MPDIVVLIARAVDPDATAPERAAALNVAARIAGTAEGLPEPPPGYECRDGRCVASASSIPPLPWRVRSKWDERPEPEPADVAEAAPRRLTQVQHLGARRRSGARETICQMIARPQGASPADLIDATGLSPAGLRVAISGLRALGRSGATFDRAQGRYVEPGGA